MVGILDIFGFGRFNCWLKFWTTLASSCRFRLEYWTTFAKEVFGQLVQHLKSSAIQKKAKTRKYYFILVQKVKSYCKNFVFFLIQNHFHNEGPKFMGAQEVPPPKKAQQVPPLQQVPLFRSNYPKFFYWNKSESSRDRPIKAHDFHAQNINSTDFEKSSHLNP